MFHLKSISPEPGNSCGANLPLVRSADFADALELSVHDRISSIKDLWLKAEATAGVSVYQRYEWVETYLKSQENDSSVHPFIVVGQLNGEVVLILPCIIHDGLLSRVKFIGGRHVNFNMGIFPSAYRHLMTGENFNRIFKRIRRLAPGIGYWALCCQPENWRGISNPLMNVVHQRSTNPAFMIDLEGGFAATLERGNAKRKRKKFRQQCRQAESLGGYEFIKADNEKTASELIEVFLAQKSKRLKSLGISDVFSDETVHQFLIDLALKSLGTPKPLLQLYALKIGDEYAAVFGAGAMNDHLSGYFSSIHDEKFSAISPGEMLLYLIVEDACEAGYTKMDLGAGDERYKRSWCTEIIHMYEVFLPFNTLAIPIASLRRIYGDIKRTIRENEGAWQAFKKVRKIRRYFSDSRTS